MATSSHWPRCAIRLTTGEVGVEFNAATLAAIEESTGIAPGELREKFADPERAPLMSIGMKIILGAVQCANPAITMEILGQRIPPGGFLPALNAVIAAWGSAFEMLGGEIEGAADENPTKVGDGSPSST